jgi:hypothetical protein
VSASSAALLTPSSASRAAKASLVGAKTVSAWLPDSALGQAGSLHGLDQDAELRLRTASLHQVLAVWAG